MNLLLDTCVVLWLMVDLQRISPTLLEVLSNPANRRFLSAASVWEIAIKWGAGKMKLPKPPVDLVAEIKEKGIMLPLPIEDTAALQQPKIPKLHSDPFDRILICQAIESGLTIVTPDQAIRRYPVKTLWM